MLFKESYAGYRIDGFSAEHFKTFKARWGRLDLKVQNEIYHENSVRVEKVLSSRRRITNTTEQGAQYNATTGRRGDWSGTPYDAIYQLCWCDHDEARLFFGLVWKKYFIDRPDCWIGYRTDGINSYTFPNRRQNLEGKTYFRPDNQVYLLELVGSRLVEA